MPRFARLWGSFLSIELLMQSQKMCFIFKFQFTKNVIRINLLVANLHRATGC